MQDWCLTRGRCTLGLEAFMARYDIWIQEWMSGCVCHVCQWCTLLPVKRHVLLCWCQSSFMEVFFAWWGAISCTKNLLNFLCPGYSISGFIDEIFARDIFVWCYLWIGLEPMSPFSTFRGWLSARSVPFIQYAGPLPPHLAYDCYYLLGVADHVGIPCYFRGHSLLNITFVNRTWINVHLFHRQNKYKC